MTEERFWNLIDQARGRSNHSAEPESLRAVLEKLSDEEILEFGHAYYEKLCDLNDWRLWAAGYVIAGGMSDDSFHYFRSWVIGKGKQVFAVAMSDPDALGPFVDDPEVDNELLEYVTAELAEERGIEEDPRDRSDRYADAEPRGEPFDEDAVAAGFPRLAAVFG